MLWTFETINATSKYYCFIRFIVLSPDSLKNTIVKLGQKKALFTLNFCYCL